MEMCSLRLPDWKRGSCSGPVAKPCAHAALAFLYSICTFPANIDRLDYRDLSERSSHTFFSAFLEHVKLLNEFWTLY